MSMQDGLETVTDLVDGIEGGAVVVEDVSISVNDDGGVNAGISVWLPEEGNDPDGTDQSAADGAGDAAARSDALAPDEQVSVPEALALPPGFGTRAAAVGADLGETLRPPVGAADRTPPADERDDPGGTSTDEPVPCRVADCEATFETDHGMKIHATKAHGDAGGDSPHRDPERLREVYETHETFEEMTEALGVDVTAQTVRRSMMSLGIHDPGTDGPERAGGTEEPTNDDGQSGDGQADSGQSEDERAGGEKDEGDPTAGDEGAGGEDDEGDPMADDGRADAGEQGPPEDTAGAGEADPVEPSADGGALDDEAARERAGAVDDLLPAAVDGETFVGAVRTADTLYEVQRELGMGREAVQSLLAELDLLDLVHGRVATRSERDVQRAEIERRIVERAGPAGERAPAE
jgi:hypothetical protein